MLYVIFNRSLKLIFFFFFFQAEDGIRDRNVTGVQTCALPIFQELFEGRRYGSSEIVQQHLERSMVVKTLNQIGYHDLEDQRRPAGSAERRALGVASDDSGALDLVAEIVERVGYDAVRLDSLSAGRLLEPGSPVFVASLGRSNFERALLVEAA